VAALFLAEFSGSTLVPLEPKSALDSLLRRLGANEKDQAQVWALLEPKGLERLSTLVGGAADYRPLVLDGPRLYLQRLHDFEGRLVAAMGARRAAVPVKRQGVKAALDEVLAQPAHDAAGRAVVLSGEQQRAVLCALHLPMTAITGGPGTGKTSIVVSILRLLVRLGVAPERIALAAPTGKAANRMKESVQRALDSLRSPGDADARLAKSLPEPRTLHRLLGYSPGRDRFVHHQGNPLAEEVVIVDEGSMIDLAMMDRLVRAVRPEAQLVLLGDADQLPSVDAGAVFRDAVPRDGGLGAKPWDKLVDGELPVAPKGQAKDGRDSYTVRLSKCFRMAEAEALQAAAEAVNRADVAALLGPKGVVVRATAAELKFEGVELLSCASPQELNAFLKVWLEKRLRALDGLNELLSSTWCFTDGAVDEAQAASLLSLRRLYESCRVLCVTRSGARPTGAAAVNRALRELWRAALGQDDSRAVFAPGEPVMMLRNDYAHNLFNGDHGFVLRAGEPGEAVALRAVFPRGAGYGLFPAEDSGAGFQHSFAMTVHKSQGSEYEQVALVLPDEEGHPLLTREILYTALTRAKKSVVIVGRPEVLRQGVAAQLERHSGIGARLAVP
jgi:exodeoxyribonuclease V alpha subunit